MEEIIFLIIVYVLSAIFNRMNKIKKEIQTGQDRGTRMTPGSPVERRPIQQARPIERPLESPKRAEPVRPQGSLGSLIRMLSGEDEAEARRLAREKQDRLYREKAAEDEVRMRQESEENERIEAQRLELETRDPNEISDAVELVELPPVDMEDMGSPMEAVSPMWDLSEAKKGIIWREILEGPKSKTRNQPNRRR